ncbi:MAG: S8 family serine peptidase [Candidatus Desulforudis sp.]|nr:S8 family serine peptidase [Desulforudis sp.]
MSKRNLLALAGAGLILFVLAVMLLTRSIPFIAADAPDNPIRPIKGPTLTYDSDKLAAGGLFVFRPGSDTPSDWPGHLARHAIIVGIPTGDGGHIVRVPVGTTLTPDVLSGAALEPYHPADRLCPELRTVHSVPGNAADLDPSGSSASSVTLTVSLFDPADKATVDTLVRQLGGSVLRGIGEEGRALHVSLPSDRLIELAEAPEVLFAETYTTPQMLNNRATAVAGITPLTIPGFATRTGLTGAGQMVAIADSGLDSGRLDDLHPDLQSEPGKMPKVPYLRSWSGGGTADPIGHGTHMAATAAGTGAASDGKYSGAAPGASIYFQAILNKVGQLEPPPDITTLFRPAREAGARIHINGWGGTANAYRGVSTQIDRFVRDYPDFLPVFGAGNTGPKAKTLTPEANSKNALIIGAAQNPRPAYGEDSSQAGEIASFSSRGPTADGRIKPDLAAPGTSVISARSRLGPEGMAGNPDYIRMQGTSQAAALAGGAAAVLREYFIKEKRLTYVPAALLKAALVNGARTAESGVEGAGFGILDLAGTVLSLRTGSFHYTDYRDGLEQGQEATYKYDVNTPGTTFRATLAWTDPAAAPGAARTLVNDLDLIVRAPDGTNYLGNAGRGSGARDDINNIEQVTIENAPTGTYTVVVRGTSVTVTAIREAFAVAQDFALVYGQLPVREAVAGYSGGAVELGDGSKHPLPVGGGSRFQQAVDRRMTPSVLIGSEIYYYAHPETPTAYLYAATWQAEGITTLSVDGQKLLTELDVRKRDGGYLFDPRADGTLRLNGNIVGQGAPFPTGSDVVATVNPYTQKLWRADLSFTEKWGVLASVNQDQGTLRLINDTVEYRTGNTAVAVTDRIVDGGWADVPFGAATPADLGRLLPGTNVYLVLSPGDGTARYIEARRLITVGMVQALDDDGITLETGKRYKVFPGATVKRDGVESSFSLIQPGDHISAVLMADSREVLSIDAHSQVRYAQVVYVSDRGQSLYLLDATNRFVTLRLRPGTNIFRWGLQVDAAALAPGQWVRLTLNPREDELWRVDIAETAEVGSGTVAAYISDEFHIKLEDGREYPISPRARVTKNGYPVRPADLRPGETIEFTALKAPAPTGPVLVSVAAKTRDEVRPPELTVSALPMEQYLLIHGRTSANRVFICRTDGTRRSIPIENGAFSLPIERLPGEESLRVVAVNTIDGGVNGVDLSFQRKATVHGRSFTDISDSWAAKEIEHLAGRGLLSGYPDGSFQPDRPVSRGEFTAILVRVLGWPTVSTARPSFTDSDRIPDWLAPSVAVAQARGLAGGYPDDTFRPQTRVTRVEAASMLVRALTDFEDPQSSSPPPFADWNQVPDWARDSVSRAYDAGFFRGQQYSLFAPSTPITREEVAAAINRYLSATEN